MGQRSTLCACMNDENRRPPARPRRHAWARPPHHPAATAPKPNRMVHRRLRGGTLPLRECVAVESRGAPKYMACPEKDTAPACASAHRRVQKRIQHQRSASAHRGRLAIPWRLAACSTTRWPRFGGCSPVEVVAPPLANAKRRSRGTVPSPICRGERCESRRRSSCRYAREARGRNADVQREMQMCMATHMHRKRGRGSQKTIRLSALSLGSGSPSAMSSFSTPCSSISTVPNSGRWSATSDQQRAMSRSRRRGT